MTPRRLSTRTPMGRKKARRLPTSIKYSRLRQPQSRSKSKMKRPIDRLISSSRSEDFEGSGFGTRVSGFGARDSGFGTRRTLGIRVPQGYALLILMMMVTLLLVSLTAALPSIYWQAQREREEELKFRLNEYAQAIHLFQQKFQRYSPSIAQF